MALSKPSSTEPVYTPGTARGAKLAALLVDEGTALVRKIFEDEVKKMNPTSLRKHLKKHKRYLCGLPYLNPGQRKTLYPDSGNVPDTAQGFDISLLELLLKELVWLELGTDAPYSSERDRLRRFRNDNYGHISSTDVSEADFDRLWKELTDILVALGGDRDKISERLNSSIDPDQERKHFELLEKLYKEDMEIKDLLLAEGQNLKKGQKLLLKGQETLLDQGMDLKVGQDQILTQGKGLQNQGDSLKKGQGQLLTKADSLKKKQDELLRKNDSLKRGQGILSAQGESLKIGQDQLLAQGESLQKELLHQGDSLKAQGESLKKGQEVLLAQGESQSKGQEEILDKQQSLKKGQEEIKSLLDEVRGAQSTGANSGQHKDSSSRTGLADVPNDIITCLKDLYATEYAHVQPLPWCEDLNLHLEEIYTNLQLQRRDGRGQFKGAGNIVSLGDIYNTRAGEDSHVNVRAAVRKIRVEGDPGIGKSCSCQKLAYDWSCGKLDRFKAVFFLEMRHLAGKVKDEIFEQLLPKDTNTTPDQLWSYIQQNQDDVLFILDGLDELSQAARQVTDVVDLIQGKILRNCHVLVTSRPYHCVKDLEKCHQFYKIVGYSEENSEKFMRKYFCESPESASKLVKQLDSNRNLSEIVVNPLNNLLICVVWEDNNGQLPSSKAELYEMIVISVAKRFFTKKTLTTRTEGDKLPPDIEAALRGLGKLSWEGLEQEQLQFNIAEIRKTYGTNADNMLTLGLLTRDYSFSRIKRTCFCAFLHKTFQEYMAARYICGLITDGSSREEGMKCLLSLFGLSKAIGIDKELISHSKRKYMEVQDWLLLILGENADPLFDMFAEQLNKAQTDEDRDALSFVCITWLGKTCAGVEMADIVAPYLSQHATNNLGEFSVLFDLHINWIVGLTHVLTCQKKQIASNDRGLIQHLTVNCRLIIAGFHSVPQERLDVLENVLSDYNALRSITLLESGSGIRDNGHTFSPLRTFIPRCGTGSVSIHINGPSSLHLSRCKELGSFRSFEDLSVSPRVEHIRITACDASMNITDVETITDLSEYDRLLARMIRKQSCLRSLRLEINKWPCADPSTPGFGNLTQTLQSISQHATLEVIEFELPRNDTLFIITNTVFKFDKVTDSEEMVIVRRHEPFDVDPMVQQVTECIIKNKVLKTLKLRWRLIDEVQNLPKKSLYGVCSTESLSNLCSAIQENRTLETLVLEGMLSYYQSGPLTRMIAELKGNKPSNYKKLNITLLDRAEVDEDFMLFPAVAGRNPVGCWVGLSCASCMLCKHRP
ncbi:uncharacterized protein LOC144918954 [Branchiostoma floridae x Branchiostoma belcheri]